MKKNKTQTVNGIYCYETKRGWMFGIAIKVNCERISRQGYPTKRAAERRRDLIRGEAEEETFYPEKYKKRKDSELLVDLLVRHDPIKPEPWEKQPERSKRKYWDEKKYYTWWMHALRNVRRDQLGGDEGEKIFTKAIEKLGNVMPGTYNHYLKWIRRVMRPEHLKGNILANPAALLKIQSHHSAKDVYYTRDQVTELFKCLKPRDKLLVSLDLVSGMRRSELFWCRKEWINSELRIIKIPNSKNKKDRIIVLTNLAWEILEQLLAYSHPDSPYVLSSPKDPMKHMSGSAWYGRHFKQARIAAKIPASHTFHTLRHTFSTWQNQKKVDELITQRSGGWSRKEVMAGYTHQEIDRIREALELTFSDLKWPTQITNKDNNC